MYPTMIPLKIGISFNSPLANILTMMAVTRAIIASNQFSDAIFTPVPESDKPISMMTGPMTTGGNNRWTIFTPCHLTSALIRK
ncbi:hypothetical protein SDC9_199701 [bioreactor metagenome]|uniref:Uncharacterized protein n=1 Tax=bioreactor metagenome TaxID=1076179 RepID=A0A645INS6_9ZZZZ